MMQKHTNRLALVLLLAAVLAPAPARAGLHIVVEGVMDFPLDVGGKLAFELPGRVRLNGSFGYMPGFMATGYTGLGQLFTKYDSSTSDAIKTGLNSSLVGRLHAGWKPWENHGFYFDLGYGFAAFGGSTSAARVFSQATGLKQPSECNEMMKEAAVMNGMKAEDCMVTGMENDPYMVKTVLHMIDLEVGWTWKLFWQFELRVAGGVSWTFAATSDVTPAYPSKAPSADETQYTKSIGDHLNARNKNMVTPIISLALGWRLF